MQAKNLFIDIGYNIDETLWEKVYQDIVKIAETYLYKSVSVEQNDKYFIALDSCTYDDGKEKVAIQSPDSLLVVDMYHDIHQYQLIDCDDVIFNLSEDHEATITYWDHNDNCIIGMLMIGCLLEHYFPGQAVIYGDVDYLDAMKAIKKLKDLLNIEVKLPILLRNRDLLRKILYKYKNIKAISWFYDLTLSYRDHILGKFIKSHFSMEDIYEFYEKRFFNHLDYSYFKYTFMEYIDMGFDEEYLVIIFKVCKKVLEIPIEIDDINEENILKLYSQYKDKEKGEKNLEEIIKSNLQCAYDFGRLKRCFFIDYDRDERESWIIRHSQGLLFSVNIWNELFDRIEDDNFILNIVDLLSLDCSNIFCKRFVYYMLYHLNIYKVYQVEG